MNDTDKSAQQVSDSLQLVKSQTALRLVRAELEGREMVSKCWRVGCIVFFLCFAALVAVCVGRGRM